MLREFSESQIRLSKPVFQDTAYDARDRDLLLIRQRA